MQAHLIVRCELSPVLLYVCCAAVPARLSLRSVGMLFLPNDDALEAQAKAIIDDVVASEGLKLLGYRQVPVDKAVVGRFAKETQPRIWQVRLLFAGGAAAAAVGVVVVGMCVDGVVVVMLKALGAERGLRKGDTATHLASAQSDSKSGTWAAMGFWSNRPSQIRGRAPDVTQSPFRCDQYTVCSRCASAAWAGYGSRVAPRPASLKFRC
jgi:hypothetical protein